MKRNFFYSIAVAVVFTLILSTCRKENADIPVESVELDISSATLEINSQITLVATVLPDDAFDQRVHWTSTNPAVATVEEGVVTAKATGEAIIIVVTEDGGLTATCKITVIKPVANISLNKSNLSLVVGAKETLTVNVVPPDATEKAITWVSSNPTVATVDNNGTVTAVSVGAAIIRATTQDGKFAQCEVIVSPAPVPVIAVTLNLDSATLNTGNTLTLTATVLPANATNQKVTWSSNAPAVATVDQTGKVTAAISTGSATTAKATIRVTTEDGTKYAECVITVNNPVSSISFDRTSLSLNINDSTRLIATILPTNATNKNVNWSTSNTNIATVENNGMVKAGNTPGVAVITVSTQDGGKTATCLVTVNSLTINLSLPPTLTINGSDTVPLTATANTTSVKWTSSDLTIAKIGGNGLVVDIIPIAPTAPPVAPATGDTTVTITVESIADPTKTASCTVTIKYVSVTSVTVTPATLTMTVGDSETLKATVLPANASIKSVTWSGPVPPPTPNVVGVSSTTGLVMALNAGTTTVTAKSNADSTKESSCSITVN